MVQTADGGGGGGGRTARFTPDEIEAIVKTVVRPAYDKVQAAMKVFESTSEGAGAFGGSDPGQALANLHASTKNVFTDTVKGVSQDLDNFGPNLSTAAKNWEHADQTAAERAQILATHLVPTAATHTHQRYDDSREREGQGLDVDPALQHEEKGEGGDHTVTAGGHGRGPDGPVPSANPSANPVTSPVTGPANGPTGSPVIVHPPTSTSEGH